MDPSFSLVSLKVYMKKYTFHVYMQTLYIQIDRSHRTKILAITNQNPLYQNTIKIFIFNNFRLKLLFCWYSPRKVRKPKEILCFCYTYFARALKEWLNDLAAKCSRVCTNTSIFNGLKLNPSSEKYSTG